MKLYSIKDGKLECKEVDTTNGMVALAHNEEVVPDGKHAFKIIARGSSKSWEWLDGICNSLVTPMHPQIQINADNSGKNGELQCKEVDTDFFKKYTTLGGLLAYDKGVPEGDTTIKVTTRNSGKSAILEKCKEIREALESATTSTSGWELGMKKLGEAIEKPSYEPPVQIVADNYMWDSNGQIQDVASMYPPNGLTLDDLNNVKIHEKICKELNETYEKKNADYGNSFENSLDKHGLIAGIVRMDDKMSRLISLNSKNEQQVMDESLRDTLMDLANYAIMSVMWLDEQ